MYCGEYIVIMLGSGVGVMYRSKGVVYMRLIFSACSLYMCICIHKGVYIVVAVSVDV